MRKEWALPKYWQDFEEMCHLLYVAEFKPGQCYRYGRAGQEQDGVDIVARSNDDIQWTGVQCKLKSEILGSKLTERQLIDAYEKSLKFSSGLTKLIVATTCVRDRDVQDLASSISQSWQRRHPVEVMFWDDFENLLDKHGNVAKQFYPDRFRHEEVLCESESGDIHITLQKSGWENGLKLFFDSSSFRAAAGNISANLMTIVSELVDNALNPGKGGASRIHIGLNGSVLTVRDDGAVFNFSDTAICLAENAFGVRGMRKSLLKAGNALEHRYIPRDIERTRFNDNVFRIGDSTQVSRKKCVASGPARYLLSRCEAFNFVNELSIPSECKSFTLYLTASDFFNESASYQLISSLRAKLNGRSLLIKIGGDNPIFLQALQEQAGNFLDVSVEQY